LKKLKPDIVLMDILMPILHGLEEQLVPAFFNLPHELAHR
jgi:YesN/AraC family two-component response regulator